MHIVIIPAFFQTKDRPTLGSFFLDQAKALKKQGHEVTILYCDTYSVKCLPEWIKYDESTESQIKGIQIYRNKRFCPVKHGMEGYKNAFAEGVRALWQKYMLNQKVDIIHAHCAVWAGYAAMKMSERTGIPYVVTEHATLFQLHKNDISTSNHAVIRQVFQQAARVICVSRAFAKLLSEYREDIDVIGNVVECDKFYPVERKRTDKKFQFLTVCYMQEEAQLYKKGIDILLKAWKELHQKNPECQLVIGGGGQAQHKAVEWCQKYDITDSVEFIGNLSREGVVERMQQCDCFVLPSRYETFGVVYIEAMACGKPVIAVQNGGPDDFVKEFNGILIEPEQVMELVHAMEKILTQKYDAEHIAEYVRGQFSGEQIAEQLYRVYQKCLVKKESCD